MQNSKPAYHCQKFGIMIAPPSDVHVCDMCGWRFVNSRENFDLHATERKWINLHSGMNLGAMLISPIVGIVRIIFSTYALIKDESSFKTCLSSKTKQYLYGQIGRGAFELIGGGYLLWIVDLIATIDRCWKEHKHNLNLWSDDSAEGMV